MASKRGPDLETQLKDIRKQLSDQLGCLEFRMESKLSLLSEYQEFFKRRGDVEYEYARSLERLCERFEKNTKQRNIKNEVRSTFNLWSTLLAETRKVSRERANLAETLATEMVSRLEIMAKDVNILTKKCKEICIEIQDQFLKELRDLSEQTKVYQHSCHNTMEAHTKLVKVKEKQGTGRKKKGKDKEVERQRQLKVQQHLLMKNRNDYLLGISRCNALSMQYFNMDIMDVIEYMDFDYHNSFQRLANAYREAEKETCEAMTVSAEAWADQSKTLNFESDLHYFLSEYSQPFTPPSQFSFSPFEADDVSVFKVNTEDVYKRARKTVVDLHEEVQTLQIQSEEDVKTIEHMKQVNLQKYQITTVDDALAVIEENGDPLPLDTSRDRGNASLERGLALNSRGGQAIQLSQKGKRDTVFFTLGILQRRVQRADRLCLANAQLDILEKSLEEQKVPPVPVGVDAQGRHIPGEVPRLFGGDVVEYIMATGLDIPLIIISCCQAIEREGVKMEGLFRVPGPAAYTEELRKGFEEGRDPLAYAQGKVDIAGVASTLKAYFRELSIPLFPTDKYREFINCSRQDDYQSRLDAVKSTVLTLHPAVIPVMRYLFRFLYRVSLHATENKMGTANLALVFGPTLTRAPDSVDPRQLHNDVPAVNVLIQMCIEKYEYLFGEDEEVLSPNTVDSLVIEEPPMSTSPPSEPPDTPQQVIEQRFSDEDRFPPPPLPPRTESTPIRETTPPLSPCEKSPSPFPPAPPTSEVVKEPSPSPVEPPQVAATATIGAEVSEESIEQQLSPRPVEATSPPAEVTPPPPEDDQLPPSVEGEPLANELSTLDAAMMEIEASIHDMGEKEEPSKPPTTEEAPSDDLSDEDSESEDEEDVPKIEAVALHDYTARSDKELSFKRGEPLQVIEKTPDHNWWDGFHDGRRGFIPVAYIEILELNKPAMTSSSLPVPPPRAPARKSSMPHDMEEMPAQAVMKLPSESTIVEESESPELARPEGDRDVKTPDVKIDSPEPESSKLDETPPVAAQSETKSPEPKKPTTPRSASGAVKAITSKFQTPEPQQQPRVLVEPRHKRQHSDQLRKPFAENEGVTQRTSSGGSKVGMISSQFETKASAAPPPPIKPKPHHLQHFPTSPVEQSTQQGAFPIMSHPKAGSLPSASPLQQIAMQSQVSQKPAQLRKPAPSKPNKGGSFKIKKDKGKSDDKSITKPPPPAKPVPPPGIGSLRDKTAELNAEFQAKALARRRHAEEGPK